MIKYLKQLKTHQKGLLVIILASVGLTLGFKALAVAPFTDDFNSYNLGEIVGQGDWAGGTGNWEVIDSLCLEGKCVSQKAVGYLIKVGENFDFGYWVVYAKILQNSGVNFEIINTNINTASAIAMVGGDLKGYSSGGYQLIKASVPIDEWFAISFEWKKVSDTERQMRYRYNKEEFTDWFIVFNLPVAGFAFSSNVPVKYDFISPDFFVGELEIKGISPESGTEITDLNSTLIIDYLNFDWDIYSGFVVNFRDNKIGAVSNSIQFLKDDLNSSGTGQVEINLQDFSFDSNGQWYLTGSGFGTHLDIEGGMFLTTRGYIDFWTDDLVKIPYYLLINVSGLPTPYTFTAPQDWYSSNVERFDTPTALFTSFVGLLSPIFEKVGEFGTRVQNMFDKDEAYDRGYALGEIFPLVSGYIQKIDLFFGGFPLASFFKYLILVMLAIFIVRAVMKFIPFFG